MQRLGYLFPEKAFSLQEDESRATVFGTGTSMPFLHLPIPRTPALLERYLYGRWMRRHTSSLIEKIP
jgi:hypothetical protein